MGKENNVVKEKSFAFAVRSVKLYRVLNEERNEHILSKQMMRSATSIGAMVRESEHAQSKADFVNKLSIALKEANETEYWLQLLRYTDYLNEAEYGSIAADCKELLRLLISIIKTTKENG